MIVLSAQMSGFPNVSAPSSALFRHILTIKQFFLCDLTKCGMPYELSRTPRK